MKQSIYILCILILPVFLIAQIEWTGMMHGNQFEYLPDGGGISSCSFLDPFQDYAYYDFDGDYCTSTRSMGLPDQQMESIYISPEGEVIIGTHAGFAIYKPNQSWETYNFRTSPLPKAAPIEAVFKDSEGVLWVSAEVEGVYALFPDGWQFYPMMVGSPFYGTAYAFVEDYLGDIWACGSFGIGHYNRDTDDWQLFHSTNSAVPIGGYNDLTFDYNSNLWVAHQWDGMIHFNTGNFDVTKYNTDNSDIASNFISALYYENDDFGNENKIWYGAADNGFGYYHIQDDSWTHWSADNEPDWLNGQVYDIARDKDEGAFWLATLGGIAKFDNGNFTSYSPGLNNFHAFENRDIAVDTSTGNVWALSVEDGPGIIYPWGAYGVPDRFSNGVLNSNAFRKVAISPSGETWVVGRDNPGVIGVYRSNRLMNASFYNQGLSYIINDITFKENTAYVATDNGFWSFDARIFSGWTHFTNNDQLDEINAIEAAPDGTIWACTKDGLFSFDGTDFTEYNSSNSGLPDDWVTHIAFEPDGGFWVATNAGGIAYSDGNGNWDHYFDSSNGLPSNQVWEVFYDLTADKIYAATEQGLFSWNELEVLPFTYPPMVGNPLGNRFRAVVVDPEGQIYAGSLAGFGLYTPGIGWQVYDDENSPLGDKAVNDIAIDQEGNKWIVGLSSTAGGLFRFNDGGPGFIPDQNQIIRGLAFKDLNQNGIYEPELNESPQGNLIVRLTQLANLNVVYTASGDDGYYEFNLLANGSYEIVVLPLPNTFYTTNHTLSYALDFSSAPPNPDTLQAIGMASVVQGMPSLKVEVTPFKVRCNQPVTVHFFIKNIGSEAATNTNYQLHYDHNLLDLMATQSRLPVTPVATHVSWEGEALGFLESEEIYAYFTGPPESETGNEICFPGEAIYFENGMAFSTIKSGCGLVYCGVDPNDKLVEPAGLGPDHSTHPDSILKYTVRFQNTGNDYAHTVSIIDTLDPSLDIETFQLINSSHPVLFDLLPGNVLSFSFPGIMLPDSASNYLGSQGFVKYEIKVREAVPDFTPVYNTAYITFDQNSPIQTNTVLNTVDRMSTSVSDELFKPKEAVLIYPNPAENFVLIEYPNDSSQIFRFELYNILGERLRSYVDIQENQFRLDRGDLPPGLYTVNISNEHVQYSGKIIFQ